MKYFAKSFKEKLFLCSRDIKFGEKFFFKDELIEMENKGSLDSDSKYWISDGKTLYSKGESYKIVGEISSDAIWVKEGDEFDQKEVMRDEWGIFKGNNGHGDVYEHDYKIKGPCGHFH